MNLYGHAVVAGWIDTDPRFVLGAMLPDLGRLAGHRRLVADAAAAVAGVAWHHRTDDAFHGSAVFVSLCRAGHDRLEAEGLPRGPAMAVAHVALELLIDGVLLVDPIGQSTYLDALASDPQELALVDAAALVDVRALLARMHRFGLPLHYREPRSVARRVVEIVASRPRLAVPEDRVQVVERWALEVRAEVERVAPRLVAELQDALLR